MATMTEEKDKRISELQVYKDQDIGYNSFSDVENPHVQTVQIMYGKGGQGVCKAELRRPEVDPYFKRTKIALGGVTKSLQAAILTLEQNPPERKFLTSKHLKGRLDPPVSDEKCV